MGRFNYSQKRASEQVSAASIKSAKLSAGVTFELEDIVEDTLTIGKDREVANDKFVFNTSEGLKSMSGREYFKLIPTEGKLKEQGEEAGSVAIATHFKIVSSTPRKDRNDNEVFPIQAYKLMDEFLDKDNTEVDWNALVAGGLTKEGQEMDPVQNYTIEIL